MFGPDFDRQTALELLRESTKIKLASTAAVSQSSGPPQQSVASLVSQDKPVTWPRVMVNMAEARNPIAQAQANARVPHQGGGRNVSRTMRASTQPIVGRQNPGRIAMGVPNTSLPTQKLTGMSMSKGASVAGLSEDRRTEILKLANVVKKEFGKRVSQAIAKPITFGKTWGRKVLGRPGAAADFKAFARHSPTVGQRVGGAWQGLRSKITGGVPKGYQPPPGTFGKRPSSGVPSGQQIRPYDPAFARQQLDSMARRSSLGKTKKWLGKQWDFTKKWAPRGAAGGFGAGYGSTYFSPHSDKHGVFSADRLKAGVGGALAGGTLGMGVFGIPAYGPAIAGMGSIMKGQMRPATNKDPRGGLWSPASESAKEKELTPNQRIHNRMAARLRKRNKAAKAKIQKLEAERAAKAGNAGATEKLDKSLGQ